MLASLKANIGQATQHLLENFEKEFAVDASDKSTLGKGRPHQHHHAEDFFSDGESSFDDSSLNQVTFHVE